MMSLGDAVRVLTTAIEIGGIAGQVAPAQTVTFRDGVTIKPMNIGFGKMPNQIRSRWPP